MAEINHGSFVLFCFLHHAFYVVLDYQARCLQLKMNNVFNVYVSLYFYLTNFTLIDVLAERILQEAK